MWGWVPIVGPIIEGIVSSYHKSKDVGLEKYRIDADINKAALQSAHDLTVAFKDDIWVRVCRDIVMLPMACWFAIGTWDKIIEHRYPDLLWNTGAFPSYGGLEYLPMAFLAFLFGLSWRAMR